MQKAIGMNSHPPPREDSVREYLKTLQRRDAQREKEQFADKGRDTLLDGYTEDEFQNVCREPGAPPRRQSATSARLSISC